MRWRGVLGSSLVAACLAIGCGSPGSSKTDSAAARPPQPPAIQAIEASAFCQKYGCAIREAWRLSTGGQDFTFGLSASNGTALEVPLLPEGGIDHFGLSFYGRDRLGEPEFQLIRDLLETIQPGLASEALLKHVRAHVERDVFTIPEAKSFKSAGYQIRAGKILNQVISIDRIPK